MCARGEKKSKVMRILKPVWVFLQIIGTLTLSVFVSIVLLQVASQQSQLKLPFKAFVVSSGSMEPTIMTGDVIFVRPRKNYGVDDVITFISPERHTVTHRIIGVDASTNGEIKIQTQGDNNNAPDPYTIAGNAIVGEWWFTIPYLGYVEVFARTPTGIIVIVSVIFGWIVSDIVWQLLKKQQAEATSKKSDSIRS